MLYALYIEIPVSVSLTGILSQINENHRGTEGAVLAYSADHSPDWRIELNHRELPYGAFGKTLPLKGLLKNSLHLTKSARY